MSTPTAPTGTATAPGTGAVPTQASTPPPPPPRMSRSGLARRFSAFLAVALVAAGVALVDEPPTASAQTTNEIWSATLTVTTNVNGDDTYGCHVFADATSGTCAEALTTDTFTYSGVSYTINRVFVDAGRTPSALSLSMNRNLLQQEFEDLNPLVLRVDGHDFRIAEVTAASGVGWQWEIDAGSPVITSLSTKSTVVVQLLEIAFGTATSVASWEGALWSKDLGNGKFGCRNGVAGAGCGDGSVFSDALFKHPGGNNYISYSVQEFSFEQLTVYARETDYRIVFTVESDWTVDLKPMTLILSVGGSQYRLAFNSAKRSNHGRTFTWRQSMEPLTHDWGDKTTYRTVTARIHADRTGLKPVRVYYGGLRQNVVIITQGGSEVRNNVATDSTNDGLDFSRWDVARAKPHRYLNSVLVAVIPGEFPSIDPSIGKVTTTHAQLRLSGSWPGSEISYAKGAWDAPPSQSQFQSTFTRGLTPRITLDAASKNTYVWVLVVNGDQTATHLVIIDPPPRTYKVNPEVQVSEGDEAAVTVNLGSPATSGGVTFDVTAAYGDGGGAVADDVGEIVSQVTVPEGQRSARIAVPTVEDYFVEHDESFTVSVSHVGSPAWAKDPEGADTTTVTITDDEAPVALPPGPEPYNINITPGDGALTVTWDPSARDGHDTSDIWHVLRWYQPDGKPHRWHNPRDPRAVGANDGLSVDPGVTSYTINSVTTGHDDNGDPIMAPLTNGVAADVYVRSMVGHRNNMSERSGDSSRWVKLNGVHTTPVAADAGAPVVNTPLTDFGNLKTGTRRDLPLTELFTDPDNDTLTIIAASSNTDVATVTVQHDPDTATATAIAVTATTPGTATITITASDPDNNQTADTFTVTVPNPTTQQQKQTTPETDSNNAPTNNAPTNNAPTTSSTTDSKTPTSGTPSSVTQGQSASQDADDTEDTDDTQDPADTQDADDTQDAADNDNDEVTLQQVRTAVEQYQNGELGYEELLDLIRRYLTN